MYDIEPTAKRFARILETDRESADFLHLTELANLER